ncbi:MAG: NYN domain-containing protein [Chloroflexi bacterium]|nr:NYN domain-containing protein [Chloroflexota bacterium]
MGMYVYIDGFNFYHGAVKNTTFKWLNLQEVCHKLFPKHDIDLIRFFTARVIGFDHDPQAPDRQDVYIRALGTLSKFQIHDEGWFARHATLYPQYPLAYRPANQKPPRRPPQFVQVQRIEEKRTDVDIATYLLVDCFLNHFDEAVVISNDGDLALPIEMVRDQFQKAITVVNPHHRSKMSSGLRKASSKQVWTINKKILATSQFASPMTDAKGSFTKPSSW